MVVQTFYLHVVPDAVTPTIYLEQYDSNLHQLVFNLVETSGYYTIPSGTSITLVGAKPDGKAFSYACTWSGHTVTFNVTDQVTNVPGKVNASLRLQNSSGNAIQSIALQFIINRSSIDGLSCSKNDFISVQDTLAGARSDAVAAANYATQARTAYNNTVSAQTTAVNAINSAKNSGIAEISSEKSSAITAVQAAQTVGVNAVQTAQTTGVNAVNSAKSTAITAVQTAQTTALEEVDTAKTTAVGAVTNAGTTVVNTVQSAANSAVSRISTSEAAAQESFDQAVAEITHYADDPNQVIYEFYNGNGNFRITALASQIGPVDEPNSVTYTYDNTTNTLTFTPAT